MRIPESAASDHRDKSWPISLLSQPEGIPDLENCSQDSKDSMKTCKTPERELKVEVPDLQYEFEVKPLGRTVAPSTLTAAKRTIVDAGSTLESAGTCKKHHRYPHQPYPLSPLSSETLNIRCMQRAPDRVRASTALCRSGRMPPSLKASCWAAMQSRGPRRCWQVGWEIWSKTLVVVGILLRLPLVFYGSSKMSFLVLLGQNLF